MNGAVRPVGLYGAEQPDLGMFSARPFSFAPCARNTPYPLLFLAKAEECGAGRPNKWPNFFRNFFCAVLLNVVFRNSNMLWFKIKHAYAEMK